MGEYFFIILYLYWWCYYIYDDETNNYYRFWLFVVLCIKTNIIDIYDIWTHAMKILYDYIENVFSLKQINVVIKVFMMEYICLLILNFGL